MPSDDAACVEWNQRTRVMGRQLLMIVVVWSLLILGVCLFSGFASVLFLIAFPYTLPLGALAFASSDLLTHDTTIMKHLTRYLWFSYITGIIVSLVFSFGGIALMAGAGIGAYDIPRGYMTALLIVLIFNGAFILFFPFLIVRYGRYMQQASLDAAEQKAA